MPKGRNRELACRLGPGKSCGLAPAILGVLDQTLLLQATERLEYMCLAAANLLPEIARRSCDARLRQTGQQGCREFVGRWSGGWIARWDWCEVGGGLGSKVQDEGIGRRSTAMFEGEDEVVVATPDDQVRVRPGPEVTAATEGLRRRCARGLACVVDL